jgi:hypothetical protein
MTYYNTIYWYCTIMCNRRTPKKRCLVGGEQPAEASFVQPLIAILPGELEDVHDQCRQLYGEKSFMCVRMLSVAYYWRETRYPRVPVLATTCTEHVCMLLEHYLHDISEAMLLYY